MKKILIISDNASDRTLGESLLEVDSNYNLAWAGFTQCKASTLTFKPDAVLMDIRFLRDNETCWKTIREIKSDRHPCRIIVIFAVNHDGEKINGFESGMDDYILSPFSTAVLSKKIMKELAVKSRDELIWGLYQASRQGEEALRSKLTGLLADKIGNDPMHFSELLDAGIAHGEAERYRKCMVEISSMTSDENIQKIINLCLEPDMLKFG